jgi:hypothetical protein
VVIAITFGMIGMFMSTWLGRTGRATVVSYMVVAALYILPIIAFVAVGVLRQAEPPRWILVPNPLSALLSAITPTTGGGDFNFLYILGLGLGGNMRVLTGAGFDMNSIPRPLYHYSVPIFGLLTLVLYFLSSQLILPTRRWRVRRRDLILPLMMVAAFAALVFLVFWLTSNRYEKRSIFAAPTPFAGFTDEGFVRAVEVEAQPMPERRLPDENPPTLPAPAAGAADSEGGDAQAALTPEDLIDIYSEVILRLYLVDHINEPGGEPVRFPVLYLSTQTDEALDARTSVTAAPGSTLPAVVRQGVINALTGPGHSDEASRFAAKLVWESDPDLDKFAPGRGTWEDGAAILFSSVTRFSSEEPALVSAVLYSAEGSRQVTYTGLPTASGWSLTRVGE